MAKIKKKNRVAQENAEKLMEFTQKYYYCIPYILNPDLPRTGHINASRCTDLYKEYYKNNPNDRPPYENDKPYFTS